MGILTFTVKAPDSNETSKDLDTEKVVLGQMAALLAYNGLCQKLRQHISHVEITLNFHQTELNITFKLRGREDQGQKELVPWTIEADTNILFSYTPDITAQQVATRIRDAVRAGIAERAKKLKWCHTQQVELSDL